MRFCYVPVYLEATTEYGVRSIKIEFVKDSETPKYPDEWCCDSFYELWGSHIILTKREIKPGLGDSPIIAIIGTELPEYKMRYCPFCGEEVTLSREEAED